MLSATPIAADNPDGKHVVVLDCGHKRKHPKLAVQPDVASTDEQALGEERNHPTPAKEAVDNEFGITVAGLPDVGEQIVPKARYGQEKQQKAGNREEQAVTPGRLKAGPAKCLHCHVACCPPTHGAQALHFSNAKPMRI